MKNKRHAIVIHTSGKTTKHDLLPTKATGGSGSSSMSPQLHQLQQWVGGMIQLVRPSLSSVRSVLGPDITGQPRMYINEEGMLRELPYNALASKILGMPVVGDVVVVANDGDSVTS